MHNIRNFSIIAHIDHGKSTLADRFIQLCGGLSEQEMSAQMLDSMDLERERGITIKAQCVSLPYQSRDGQQYRLNFIDTPGHVDFSYEVSRSLAACEGALLVVDSTQGVEAQTVANCSTALDLGLEVLPVLNKIDLPAADVAKVGQEIEDIIGLDASEAITVSAKTGLGIEALLEQLVERIPPPQGDPTAATQALVIDSWFDSFVGVIALVRIVNGEIAKGKKIRILSSGKDYTANELGTFSPQRTSCSTLSCGEVGYLIAGIKEIDAVPVGATITLTEAPCETALPGFKQVQAKIFASIYPVQSDAYEALREALRKLRLNDSALQFEPENSKVLGFGFRCGFLGRLHMEIVQERLEREYRLDLLCTAPSVVYQVLLESGERKQIHNPADLPARYQALEEPIVKARIMLPPEHIGEVIKLCQKRRGIQLEMRYAGSQVLLDYALPLADIAADFFDKLKSVSRGYASLDYQFSHFQKERLVRLDMLINNERIGALSLIVHNQQARFIGQHLTVKMQSLIPRQMFDVAIQAAIGGQIIARSTVKALRKNVTAKCYGGDITRKRKLLEKQKAGKRRMKQIGQVELPQEAFWSILQTGQDN